MNERDPSVAPRALTEWERFEEAVEAPVEPVPEVPFFGKVWKMGGYSVPVCNRPFERLFHDVQI